MSNLSLIHYTINNFVKSILFKTYKSRTRNSKQVLIQSNNVNNTKCQYNLINSYYVNIKNLDGQK